MTLSLLAALPVSRCGTLRTAQRAADLTDSRVHRLSVLGYLLHRFDLELIRISLASHKDLLGCRKLWLQVVYESLGGPRR
jgi:hypothetical protein